MSELTKLAIGIVVVAVGMVLFLSGKGFMPVIALIIGLAGTVIVVRALRSGKL